MQKHKIAFYNKKDNEYIDNIVYMCDSEIISKIDNIFIAKKSNLVKMFDYSKSSINENLVIIFTYVRIPEYDQVLRGYLYFENKEYKITNYVRYSSLQIGSCCYDEIGICYLDENIFATV
jgi:hypothetical protein